MQTDNQLISEIQELIKDKSHTDINSIILYHLSMNNALLKANYKFNQFLLLRSDIEDKAKIASSIENDLLQTNHIEGLKNLFNNLK